MVGGVSYPEGAMLTLDGNNGNIYSGVAIVTKDVPTDLLARLERLRSPA